MFASHLLYIERYRTRIFCADLLRFCVRRIFVLDGSPQILHLTSAVEDWGTQSFALHFYFFEKLVRYTLRLYFLELHEENVIFGQRKLLPFALQELSTIVSRSRAISRLIASPVPKHWLQFRPAIRSPVIKSRAVYRARCSSRRTVPNAADFCGNFLRSRFWSIVSVRENNAINASLSAHSSM